MAATAYALSAIILVFYFGNLAGFEVNPNEVKANAATYEESDRIFGETNTSESTISDIKEYALNSPDHKILLDHTTTTEDMASKQELGIYNDIYPFGQLSISPAVTHYNSVIASMAILTAQQYDKASDMELTVNPTEEDSKQVSAEVNRNHKDKKTENKKTTDKKQDAEETLAKTDRSVPANLKLVTNKKMIKSLSEDELKVLYRIVEAEATGEDIYGKILVANVVLNRVNSSEFPNNVTDVVFQKVGSSYQFSPTKDGRYYSVKVTKSTKEAVNRALSGEDYSNGALYFFARKLTSQKKANWFDQSLRKVVQYGCHEFYANK